MRARQNADLGHNRANRFRVAPIDPISGIQNIAANHVFFEILEQATEKFLGIFINIKSFNRRRLRRSKSFQHAPV